MKEKKMKDTNVIIFVYEDDHDFRSMFAYDLPNILNLINSDVSVSLEYHSRYIHGDYFMSNLKGFKSSGIESIHGKKQVIHNMTQLCKRCYLPDKRNIFIYVGHCYLSYIRPESRNVSMNRWIRDMKESNIIFDLTVFDCCNTSEIRMLTDLSNISKYYLGCESTAPYLGYTGTDMVKLFKYTNMKKLLKYWVSDFIKRNDQTYTKITFPTDSVAIDLKKFKSEIKDVDIQKLKPLKHLRVISGNKYLVDLVSCLAYHNEHIKFDCIISYNQSYLLHKTKKSEYLNGISLNLK